jgi:hypothetical protein
LGFWQEVVGEESRLLVAKRHSHGSFYFCEIHLARDGVDRNGMKFDLQVCCALVERSVAGGWNNPKGTFYEVAVGRPELCTDISGSLIPLVARAQSRYVLTAMMILSVPPEVIVPAPVGLLNIL